MNLESQQLQRWEYVNKIKRMKQIWDDFDRIKHLIGQLKKSVVAIEKSSSEFESQRSNET